MVLGTCLPSANLGLLSRLKKVKFSENHLQLSNQMTNLQTSNYLVSLMGQFRVDIQYNSSITTVWSDSTSRN